MVTLGTRLEACAGFVLPGAVVADIGTDHALLPVWLIQNDIAESAFASDIAPLPLERARKNVAANGLEDKIKLVLAPGLEGIEPGSCDHVIIAGMGGDVIVSILSAARWLPDEGCRVILQPMSRTPLVRKYLFDNGWKLTDETPVFDAGRAYSVLLCEKGKNTMTDPIDMYVGLLPKYPCSASDRLFRKEAGILRDMAKGASGEEKNRLTGLARRIEKLIGDE